MRNYRYKVQTSEFALFVGVAAESLKVETPPTDGIRVSERLWLDAADVRHGFSDLPLRLTEDEFKWLLFGLGKVARDIEQVVTAGHVVVALKSIEIVEVDYLEVSLAPAIVGWATEEFGLTRQRVPVPVTRDKSGRFDFEWNN